MKSEAIMFIIFSVIDELSVVHSADCSGVTIISRKGWAARPPRSVIKIPAVSYVFIHHTVTGQCFTTDKCSAAVRNIQNYHMDTQKWPDIGYSFIIGGDGKVYEGRGWGVQGAHTYGFNNNGIGIALIGDFTNVNAPSQMIVAAKKLIECGVKNNQIKSNYKLLGHRDVYQTACPGDKLYAEIKKWQHYQSKP